MESIKSDPQFQNLIRPQNCSISPTGGSGIVCGVMVSNPLCTVMYAVSQNKTSHYYHDHNFAKCWL